VCRLHGWNNTQGGELGDILVSYELRVLNAEAVVRAGIFQEGFFVGIKAQPVPPDPDTVCVYPHIRYQRSL